jgi:hypothetical protein
VPDQRELVHLLAQEILGELRAPDPKAGQSTAGATPPPARSRDIVLAALVLAGVLLFQRGEATASAVEQQGKAAAETTAAINARVDALQKAQEAEQRRAVKNENTLREALIILADDTRAEWDALTQIHEATRKAGQGDLRQPGTPDRLTGLRGAMAVDRDE